MNLGWDVFDVGGGRLEIQRDDELALLQGDDEALEAACRWLADTGLKQLPGQHEATRALEVADAIRNTIARNMGRQ